jgi:ABC-type branched-subunit amino acid transport system substrate-binding protein
MKKLVITTIAITVAVLSSYAQGKKSNNISLLLPFCGKQILENPNYKDAELGNLCREYYQGALIALDSCERARIPVRLSVFDTENDSMTVVGIMQKTNFKESELIIGPVKQNGNLVLSQFCKKNEVFHISPLMTFSKSKIDDPFWISANPDLPAYATILTKHITTTDPLAQIIVVIDKSVIGKSIGAAFKQLSTDKKLKIKVIEYSSALDVKLYSSSVSSNHIVIAALQEGVVNATLRNIKDTSNISNLHTYGFMQWFDFKTIDYTILQRVNPIIISPFFVDYTKTEVKTFVEQYRERFNTEPSEAAFKGYDQMLLFSHALSKQGKRFMDELNERNLRMLGTNYYFVKQKNGSYQSMYLNLLRLENFKLIPIN